MKKYSQIIAITLIILMCFIVIFPHTKVYGAAGATISASKTTMTVGETIKINVSVSGTETWNLKVTSNGGSLSGTMQDADAAGSEVSKQVISGNFTASAAGTYKITLSGTIAGSDLKKQTVSKTVTITVNNKANSAGGSAPSNNDADIPKETNPGTTTTTKTTTTKSSNNYLSSLKVSEGTLSPEFSFRTYQYTVNVGEEVNSIKVTASAEHNKAKVSGTGTKTLKPGENKINITVKAEDGKQRTYTIIVNKPEEKKEVVVGLKSLLVKGVSAEEEPVELSFSPEFSSEVYEYKIALTEEQSDITKLDIEAVALQEDFTIDIIGNEELQDGENVISIIVKSQDGEISKTYNIIVTKEGKVMPVTAAPIVEVEQEVVQPLWNRTQQILITVFTSIIALMGIAYAVIEYRYKKGDEETTKIPYSGLDFEKENEEEEKKFFDKIGYKKEEKQKEDNKEKESIVKEEEEVKIEDIEEDTKPKSRGKHF